MNKTTDTTQTTKHIAMLTRQNGWGVKCWTCDFAVSSSRRQKTEAQQIANSHVAEAR